MGNALAVIGNPTKASDLNDIKGRTVTAGAGGIAAYDVVYLSAADTVLKADCDAAATMPAVGICPAAITAAATGDMVSTGIVTNGSWSWTVGAPIYVSGTAGGLTQTKPVGISATGVVQIIQCVGIAYTATSVWFNFDQTGPAYLDNNPIRQGNWLHNAQFDEWEAGTSVVPDWWSTGGTAAFARESGVTNVLFGTYSCKMTSSNGSGNMYQNPSNLLKKDYYGVLTRTFTFAAWVKTSTASACRLRLNDDVGNSYSAYHTGGGGWERLSATRVMNSAATLIACYLFCESASATLYIDGMTFVEGAVDPGYSPSPFDNYIVSVQRVANIAAGTTGSQSITGLPRRPKKVTAYAGNGGAGYPASVGVDGSYRVADDTLWSQKENTTNIPFQIHATNDLLFQLEAAAGGTGKQGTSLTFNSDGITWTNTNISTGEAVDLLLVFDM